MDAQYTFTSIRAAAEIISRFKLTVTLLATSAKRDRILSSPRVHRVVFIYAAHFNARTDTLSFLFYIQ